MTQKNVRVKLLMFLAFTYYLHVRVRLYLVILKLHLFWIFFLQIGLDNLNEGKRNLKNTIVADTSNSLFNRGYDRGNDFRIQFVSNLRHSF